MTTEAMASRESVSEGMSSTEAVGNGILWLERFLRPNEGWIAAFLLVLNLVVVVLSVEQANWAPSPNLIFLLFLAMLTGLFLYRIPIWSVALLPVGLAVGFAVILWQLSSFDIEGVSVGGSGQVLQRLDLWLDAARTGSINIDRLPFSFGLMTATWLTGFLGSWLFLRYSNFWGVFVLGGIGLLSNLTFLPPNAAFHLGFYLFTALLLVARVQSIRRKNEWEQRGVRVDQHLSGLTLSDSLWITIVVIVVAFLLPMAPKSGTVNGAYETMRNPLQAMEGDFNRLFAGLPARRPLGFRIWDDVMALQGSINPTTTQVLWVDSPAELYWKARTYGTYNGKGWFSENTVNKPLGYIPEFSSGTPDLLRTAVTYSVTPLYASKQLFSGDQVLDVDRDVVIETQAQPLFTIDVAGLQQGKVLPSYLRDTGEALVHTVDNGGVTVSDQDLSDSLPLQFRLDEVEREGGRVLQVQIMESLPPIPEVLSVGNPGGKFKVGEPYQVTSAVSLATPVQLRLDDSEYPAWVMERYLQLPSSLPQRVRDLAVNVTAGKAAPYDQAKAIEVYLQTNFAYNLSVKPPPFDGDGVDHFLFTLGQGYSEYFASTMSVMLRSLDVPARLAVGYTTGDQVGEEELYSVTDSHSHAWVEVYFPGFGWIPFEPTPGEALPDIYQPGDLDEEALAGGLTDIRPSSEGCLDEFDEFVGCEGEELLQPLGQSGGDSGGGNPLIALLPWVIGVLGALAAAFWTGRWFWRRFLAAPSSPGVAFQRMSTLAFLASAGPADFQTPYQFGSQLQQVFPAQEAPVSIIVTSYVRSRYGNKTPTDGEQRSLAEAWRTLRLPMLWAVIRRRVR
ncbi:MAG: hypothetical protein BZY87_09940 [SAR202 cluster bacterium Io17-Chloro-G6]|nr:MAG: hypothetical protein BZY87_09940 [SAR202 cluster bacterium Io17-Chloro-G6]